MAPRYVPIAEIARPHGVHGELRLKLYNEGSSVISKGRKVVLLEPPGKGRGPGERTDRKPFSSRAAAEPHASGPTAPNPTRIAQVREGAGALLVRLEGIHDRDAAEALRGVELAVPRDELPELDAGEFYACDVEGARVELTSGDVIGRVLSLESYPTCDVLRIALDEGRTIEVPLVDSYVALIDADSHLVKLHHIAEL
jgi:16S rRNA processing protein RimM